MELPLEHGTPPPERAPWVPILCPAPHAPVRAVCLSPSYVALWSHWAGREEGAERLVERICTAFTGRCEHCDRGCVRRWTAWAAGWVPNRGRVVLLRLTAGAARNCRALLTLSVQADLRGRWFCLSRIGDRRNSPMALTISAPMPTLDSLPPPPRMDLLLARVYPSTL